MLLSRHYGCWFAGCRASASAQFHLAGPEPLVLLLLLARTNQHPLPASRPPICLLPARSLSRRRGRRCRISDAGVNREGAADPAAPPAGPSRHNCLIRRCRLPLLSGPPGAAQFAHLLGAEWPSRANQAVNGVALDACCYCCDRRRRCCCCCCCCSRYCCSSCCNQAAVSRFVGGDSGRRQARQPETRRRTRLQWRPIAPGAAF